MKREIKVDDNGLCAYDVADWTERQLELLRACVKHIESENVFITPKSIWDSIVDGLIVKEDEVKYPNYLFLFKGEHCYFYYDKEKDYLWCSETLVWNRLRDELKKNVSIIKDYIQEWCQNLYVGTVRYKFLYTGSTSFLCAEEVFMLLVGQHFHHDKESSKNQSNPYDVWASILDGLEQKEDRAKYPSSIFWFKNGECYFEYDEKSRRLWCRYTLVWSVFESKFNWKHIYIMRFIERMFDEHFKLKGVIALKIAKKLRLCRWSNVLN